MMRVVRWTDDQESLPPAPVGGVGGWFGVDMKKARDNAAAAMSVTDNFADAVRVAQTSEVDTKTGDRWKDYLNAWNETAHPYLEALRKAILEKSDNGKVPLTGQWHQEDEGGTPVFDDGTVAEYSLRGWGDLCAAIFSELEDENYTYMAFYYVYWRGI